MLRFVGVSTLLLLLLVASRPCPIFSFSVDGIGPGTSTAVRNAAMRTVVNSIVAPVLLATAAGPLLALEPAHASTTANAGYGTTTTLQRLQETPPSGGGGGGSKSPTEDYLPRKLYPGTYKNYCGPTPETKGGKGGCIAHGWYGDAPADEVDEACRTHDVSYCNCETGLRVRQREEAKMKNADLLAAGERQEEEDREIPLLASMVALRFATKPALERTVPVDAQYFNCIDRADRTLISTGVKIRSEQQRAGCSTDPNLAWFCDLGNKKGTLATFEKVNMSIFLRDLDADDANDRPGWSIDRILKAGTAVGNGSTDTLAKLERRRETDLRSEIRHGKAIADAVASSNVQADEEKLLRRLAVE